MTSPSPIRPCADRSHADACGCQTVASETVTDALRDYVGADRTPSDLPLDTLRDDLLRIIHGHETVASALTIPRGNDGACDLEAFDHDGQTLVIVVLDVLGRITVLPPVDRYGILAPCASCGGDVKISRDSLPHITVANVRCYPCGSAAHLARVAPAPADDPTLNWSRTDTDAWTPLDWHHYISAAGNFADAGDRMQEAADAGVDFAAMRAAAEGC